MKTFQKTMACKEKVNVIDYDIAEERKIVSKLTTIFILFYILILA